MLWKVIADGVALKVKEPMLLYGQNVQTPENSGYIERVALNVLNV